MKNLSNLTNFVDKSSKNGWFYNNNPTYIMNWNKFRQLFKGTHGKFTWFVIITSCVFLLLWMIGPGNTIIHWVDAAVEVRRQGRQIEMYEKENAEMDRRLQMLRTDRDTLEKFAREQFYFAVPDEDVYIIER